MFSEQKHIIKKVRAELTVSSSLSQEGERAEQLKRVIQKALDNIVPELDRLYGDDLSYRLEYLPVELNMQQDELLQLETLLEEALIEKVINAGQKADLKSSTESKKQHLEKVEPGQRQADLLKYFLQTGQFPWWAEGASFEDIEERLWNISANEWKEIIRPLGRSHQDVLNRLTVQFPKDLLRELVKKSSVRKESYIDEIIKTLKSIDTFLGKQHGDHSSSRRLIARLYEHAFTGVLVEEEQETILRKMIGTVLERFQHKEYGIEEWGKWIEKIDEDKSLRLDLTEEVPEVEKEKEREQLNKDSGIREDEGLPVSNGGLVLLHPFIEKLFENLGLLEEGKFSQDTARERAVCLLYYMATGRKEFPEHELVLPKYVCVWPFREPVNRFLPISDYETKECDAVLNSAISHWEALKSTSIEGIRRNFIQRKGILREEEFGWSLYVERETQDILLEKLPWSLSVVKLEWMDEMLTVHWQ